MSDFYEIDFLDVESKSSGDAIPLRYQVDGKTRIHVVDGGFQDTGDSVVKHIKEYYDNPKVLNAVIVTHPDGDHAGGLRTVLEEFDVEKLWMLRPWEYAEELLPKFPKISSVENLKRHLRDTYPNLSELEKIAKRKGIEIEEPFQGAEIGAFSVLAPTKERYLRLILESDKTSEAKSEDSGKSRTATPFAALKEAARGAVNLVKAAWGEEVFSNEETSSENEMSVVQYGRICDRRIVLTGDAGREGLTEAANFAGEVGLNLPGVDVFQIPHHGSRRNVSSEVLDRWFGPKLDKKPERGQEKFYAYICSAFADKDHPRKSVIRAFIHRGAGVVCTENKKGGVNIRTSKNAPDRGWSSVDPVDYPDEQED